MTPVLALLSLTLLQTVKLAINCGDDVGFLILDSVVLHIMEQIGKAVLALDRRERQAFTAPLDLGHPLLVVEEQPIQAGMKLLDLDLGQALPLLHGVFQTLAHDLITHVEILCHASSPTSLLALLCLVPLPLRFPLRAPCRIASTSAFGALWAEVTIRVACAPDHAVAQMPFRNIDLLPALCSQAFVTFLRSMQPGEQALRSRPEGTENFETGKAVHRLLLWQEIVGRVPLACG